MQHRFLSLSFFSVIRDIKGRKRKNYNKRAERDSERKMNVGILIKKMNAD